MSDGPWQTGDVMGLDRYGASRPSTGRIDTKGSGKRLDGPEGAPLYLRVRASLLAELDRGTWKPGDMLPTELQLSEKYSVSPGTMKQAILGLVREGRIFRRPGKGTFVTRPDANQSFARFFSFRSGATGEELHPSIRVIAVQVLDVAPPEAARHLKIGKKEKVLFARRLLVEDNTPICIYDSYIPYRLVAGLENERLDVDRIYHAIEKKFGIHVVSVEEMLRAAIVAGEEAILLDVPVGSPVIQIERIAHSHNSTVVEWRQTLGRSDRFIYKIRIPRAEGEFELSEPGGPS